MKKLSKLLTAVSMSVVTLLTCTACDCGNTVNNDIEDLTNLNIMLINRGYGVDWCYEMAEAFEDAHDGIKVHITEAIEESLMDTNFRLGKEKNDTDLYFGLGTGQSTSRYESYSGIDGGLQCLDDLYATEIPGEGVTYGDKMYPSIREELKLDNGHFYTSTWQTGIEGLFYNETVLNNVLGSGNWQVPVTSDELLSLGNAFKNKGAGYVNKFFINPGGLDAVCRDMFLPWWAQYEGVSNYKMFWNGQYYNVDDDEIEGNSHKIYLQKGRLEAFKAVEALCRQDNGLAIKNAAEITQLNFKNWQIRFFENTQNYAMYPCGDWLEQESALGSNSVVKMMKVPVVSAITDKCESIADDAELASLIRAIDNGQTALTGTGYEVSQADFDRIKEARSVVFSSGANGGTYIPAYANAKKLAYDFLLFMASDEGLKIYKDNVKGGTLPFNYDYAKNCNLTTLEKSVVEAGKDATFIFESYKNPLFYKAGIYSIYLEGARPEVILGVTSSSSQYKTAEQVYNWYIDYYSDGVGGAGAHWNSAISKLS